MREIKFGVIGCGLMGREFASAAARWMHLLAMPAKPVIVAVSDVNPTAMEWFAAHHPGIKTTTNYHDLLADPAIEAIYCAVPHNMHEQIYIDCIRAGKHLFAEKPFGIDLSAAEKIIQAIKKSPQTIVRCSSEFPFFPAAQRIVQMVELNAFGQIMELRAGFCHSSDLDPNKPINWKRKAETNGEYGCMGDLGLHVLHLPLRFGFQAKNVRALLTNIFPTRPNGAGNQEPCDTWDNAILACETHQGFPMILETKRVSPGDTDSWYIKILGTKNSAEFNTKHPKTLRTMPYQPGGKQAWQEEDLGYSSAYPTITGPIFEFGFPGAILQMWAAFIDELAGNKPKFQCATPDEALASHHLFTAALESQRTGQTVTLK
ncbi:MAG: Gfo/Idh/MocA family oxidoreductase [Armatimonadota bacterium]